MDTHLDGNALGGLFHDIFGQEMTHRSGRCKACGTISRLAAVMVYRGAGDVLRCPACGEVVMVVVSSPAGMRITFGTLQWLEVEAPTVA